MYYYKILDLNINNMSENKQESCPHTKTAIYTH